MKATARLAYVLLLRAQASVTAMEVRGPGVQGFRGLGV